MRHGRLVAFLAAGLATVVSSPAWATDWNESVNSDLSGDRLNPTPITLTQGSSPGGCARC